MDVDGLLLISKAVVFPQVLCFLNGVFNLIYASVSREVETGSMKQKKAEILVRARLPDSAVTDFCCGFMF